MKNEAQRITEAKNRINDLKGFYTHLLVYVVININLFGINYFTRGDNEGWWFYWPLMSWGFGLFIHAFITYITGTNLVKKWEINKMKELMSEEEK